jgi:hypothetical protein
MALYADTAALAAWLADTPDVALPADDEAAERLLRRAEERVDAQLGALPAIYEMGRKLDPGQLRPDQIVALRRATCAAAEHELTVGLDYLIGSEDYGPEGVVVLRQPLRTSPRMLEELAGHGFPVRSGCVPTPEPPQPL